jgi:hypothetical protein
VTTFYVYEYVDCSIIIIGHIARRDNKFYPLDDNQGPLPYDHDDKIREDDHRSFLEWQEQQQSHIDSPLVTHAVGTRFLKKHANCGGWFWGTIVEFQSKLDRYQVYYKADQTCEHISAKQMTKLIRETPNREQEGVKVVQNVERPMQTEAPLVVEGRRARKKTDRYV